ncbi:two-component system, response regulator YesN [Paenibacillus algorifonticola]|uniref:Two-component system, response regulator YesN n=1 Tax=Paenibacillus algorifonticola TaxID=684063 RepID=A0A1I2GA76_9BACL|nr:response regulator [Paenibacillus algorifonticola]SFF14049.1 two-component system, response regulator YesN [Paenibacillus algorifonticola]
MYKVLLVDDEEETRSGLLQEIAWERNGFEIVETAANGREAMELIERLEPDIVVTDISMPYMNGLELAEWMRKTYPLTRIVIFSGYDEFEYAKQAIGLQVDEYILKPFSAQQLLEVMDKVKERLDDEREKRENMQLLQEHYRTSLPVVKELFLSSLLSRKLPLRHIEEKAEKYELDLAGEAYIVSVLHTHVLEALPGVPLRTAESSLAASSDLDLKLFALRNVAEEVWGRLGLGKVFLYQDQVALLAVGREGSAQELMERTLSGLAEMLQNIRKYLRFPVTIGVSSMLPDVAQLKQGYEEAQQALDYHNLVGSNRIICIDDVETRYVEELQFDELKEQALIRCLRVGTHEELEQLVAALFDEIEGVNAAYREYQLYMLEMMTAIMKLVKEAGLNLYEIAGYELQIYAELGQLSGLEETRSWYMSLCEKIRHHIASRRQSSYKQLVEEAVRYTKANFHDSELSIARLCSHLHISAGYFSSLFKKEVKLTFGGYLLQLRMEAAKEMLRATELKTFEIAEKVGFSDPNYFSLCFKKNVGVSAKDYRNQAMNVDAP